MAPTALDQCSPQFLNRSAMARLVARGLYVYDRDENPMYAFPKVAAWPGYRLIPWLNAWVRG